MKYERLNPISKEYANEIFKNNNVNELKYVSLSLGEYCDDWRFAQDFCIKLLNNDNEEVRANAALGLSYIAKNHRQLEKKRIKKSIINALRITENAYYRERIVCAIDDICFFMNWKRPWAVICLLISTVKKS